jgi:hypothetical protein
VSGAPAPDFAVPDLPPGAWKLAAVLALAFAARVVWGSGLLDPGRLHSPLRGHRLRRKAYRVVCEAGLAKLVGDSDRATQAAHARQTIRKLKRNGRYAVYAEIRHRPGLDLSEGSSERAKFEGRWRHAMTRPDEHGNPAHEWSFSYYVGTSTVLARWAALPHAEATRLFRQLQPTVKWSEGVRPADVVTATDDGFAVQVPHGFRYDKAEIRLGIQRQVNLTVSSPTGAWRHDWAPQRDRYQIAQVPPLPRLARWEPDGLRPWTPDGPEPALPVGVTHGGEIIWWEYQREGQIHAGIFGQTGAGKTGSAQSIVAAALLSGFEQVVILDPKADKDWAWLGAWPAVTFAYSLDHIADALAAADRKREARSRRQMQATQEQPGVDPPLPRPILVFLDEASALFTRQRAGDASKEADFLRSACAYRTNNIAIMGRSANIHLFVGTQRPRADSIDSNTKAQLGFRIGLGDLDSTAARMIFDTTEAATDRDLGEVLGRVTAAGRGYAGTVGSALTEAQLFYRSRADLIALLGPPPEPKAKAAEAPEQVFDSQNETIVVPSPGRPLSDWG